MRTEQRDRTGGRAPTGEHERDAEWDRYRRRCTVAPDGGAWLLADVAAYPSVSHRAGDEVLWRDLRINRGMVGLVPARERPDRVTVGRSDGAAPWPLPVPGITDDALAWHPQRPLVAGLAVREGRLHPWVADYQRRTMTQYPQVRAALGLSGHGARRGAPLAWSRDGRLLLLAPPAPAAAVPDTSTAPQAVAYEATGPGYVSFAPGFSVLHDLAAVCVTALDPADGTTTVHSEPRLIQSLTAAPSGDRLLVRYAEGCDDDRSGLDALRWAADVLGLHAAAPPAAVAPDARWVPGEDVLAWASPADGGILVHFRDPEGLRHTVPVPGAPRWWPVWQAGAATVLVEDAAGLSLITAAGAEPLASAGTAARLAAAPLAVAGGRLIFACGGPRQPLSVAVVDATARTVVVASAPHTSTGNPGGSTGNPGTAWCVERGGTVDVLSFADDRLTRYTLLDGGLRPAGTLVPPARTRAGDRLVRSRRPPTPAAGGAHFTLHPGDAGEPGRPLLLWLRATERHASVGDPPPATLTATGRSVATLDLALRWPAEATADLLREQVVDAVRAGLRAAVQLGHHRVIVGGHSFGATLALLALADMPEIAAAIAHSGCYNRTLTPFGFQYERRSYWSVPQLYHAFSALHQADRLDRPVLIVHGAEDTNPATPPDQAVALYRGIVATGGHARLLLLPHEGHTFRYRETQRLLTREHRSWMDRFRIDQAWTDPTRLQLDAHAGDPS